MPIYDYRCNNCNNLFEVLVTSSASTDDLVCTKCKSKDIKKTISAGSYRLNRGSSTPTGALSGCSPKSGFS
ncbi:MAG: zinc ribbon domain-containing protein [Desulfobulbaceae bacterium]|nr:zinc ribbon domain-containing protein [Desulfobulbaceae bacterium]